MKATVTFANPEGDSLAVHTDRAVVAYGGLPENANGVDLVSLEWHHNGTVTAVLEIYLNKDETR